MCTISTFCINDTEEVGSLFFDTVHSVNASDCTKEQLEIWAPIKSRSGRFPRPLENNFSIVAEKNKQIVGFADITKEGYIDRFFVHKDFQSQGKGNLLLSVSPCVSIVVAFFKNQKRILKCRQDIQKPLK